MDAPLRAWDKLVGDRLRLRELGVLHAAIRHGSMAQAALALGMTQASVSQAIGRLEAAVGASLLERSPAGVTPTQAGVAMLGRAVDALDVLAAGVAEARTLSGTAATELIIGASESYIAGGALARIALGLGRSDPDLRLTIVESNTAAMDFADLYERRVDVMLGRVGSEGLPEDLQQTVLLQERLLVVAGARHEWSDCAELGWADVSTKSWLLAPAGSAVYELVAASFRGAGLAMPAVPVTTYSMMLRLQLLAAGDYVTAVPSSLVTENSRRWDLRVLPLALEKPLRVAAFTLKSRARDSATQKFLEEARKQSC